AGDRCAVAERRTEVTADHAAEEASVLHEQRLVESERMTKLSDVLLRRAFAEHRLRRIAGHQMDQREHERGHADENRDREQQPLDEIPQPGAPKYSPPSRRG